MNTLQEYSLLVKENILNKTILRERFSELIAEWDGSDIDEFVEELVTAVVKAEMLSLFEPDDNDEEEDDDNP